MEVEYRGAAMVACEIAWLCKPLQEMGHNVLGAATLYCDNMSNIQSANNSIFHARTKHIEVHYHYVCKKVLVGDKDLV